MRSTYFLILSGVFLGIQFSPANLRAQDKCSQLLSGGVWASNVSIDDNERMSAFIYDMCSRKHSEAKKLIIDVSQKGTDMSCFWRRGAFKNNIRTGTEAGGVFSKRRSKGYSREDHRVLRTELCQNINTRDAEKSFKYVSLKFADKALVSKYVECLSKSNDLVCWASPRPGKIAVFNVKWARFGKHPFLFDNGPILGGKIINRTFPKAKRQLMPTKTRVHGVDPYKISVERIDGAKLTVAVNGTVDGEGKSCEMYVPATLKKPTCLPKPDHCVKYTCFSGCKKYQLTFGNQTSPIEASLASRDIDSGQLTGVPAGKKIITKLTLTSRVTKKKGGGDSCSINIDAQDRKMHRVDACVGHHSNEWRKIDRSLPPATPTPNGKLGFKVRVDQCGTKPCFFYGNWEFEVR